MRVTHIITRLVVGGAQENTIATVLGLRAKPGVTVHLISGLTTGPEGSLESTLTSATNPLPLPVGRGEGRGEENSSDLPNPKTSNIQHPTSNVERSGRSRTIGCWMLDVGRWMFPSFSVQGSSNLLTIVPTLVRPVHPWKDLLALHHLTRLLKEQKPDIVHTHSGKAGILGRIAAARAKVPVIIHHIHGPSFGSFQGALANLVFTAAERYAAKFTTHFLCSAQAMTKVYLAAGIGRPEMYTRVFSGFPVEPFINATNDPLLRDQLRIPRDAFVIGKIARFFPLKGHADLLNVFEKLLPQCPQAHLLLVGDGILRPQIERAARERGLAAKVTFTGLVPPDEVPRYVGIMDCLAHLSSREALARALPQALAAGKPVVAYDFDGASEVCLDNQTGFLVRLDHENAAAERLLLLARDPKLRAEFGQRGQQFVRENFAVAQMVENIYRLYQKLAGRTAPR